MLPLSSQGQLETTMSDSQIKRFSSRRQPIEHTFLAKRLNEAKAYDRIAGYFSSSLLEVVGEELETVKGTIRVICNSNLHPLDIRTAKAAKMAVDIHGGYGCMEEFPVTRYLRDSFVLGPSAGTSDIMKVIISRWALS